MESRGFLIYDQKLNATQFRVGMTQVSWEWASLPPGQYGQPTRSLEALWRYYQEWTNSLFSETP
jgi:muramidase (phage lysozyme)